MHKWQVCVRVFVIPWVFLSPSFRLNSLQLFQVEKLIVLWLILNVISVSFLSCYTKLNFYILLSSIYLVKLSFEINHYTV